MQSGVLEIDEAPLANGLDSKGLFHTATIDEALARMHYLIDAHRRVGLLVGTGGIGKSHLLTFFAEHNRRAKHSVCHLNLVGVTTDEFPWLVARQVGLVVPRRAGVADLWRTLTDRMAENRYQRKETIVLLDDVHLADERVLDQVFRLVNLDPAPNVRLTTVLATREDALGRVPRHLTELVELRIELDRWSGEETESYLANVNARGVYRGVFLLPEAMRRVHELSGGIPRRINRLVDMAVIAAAGDGSEAVDETTVDRVNEELVSTISERAAKC